EGHAGVDRGIQHLTGAVDRLGAGAGAAEVVAAEADGRHEQSGGADAARGKGGHSSTVTRLRAVADDDPRRRAGVVVCTQGLGASGASGAGGSGEAGGAAGGSPVGGGVTGGCAEAGSPPG